jgi:hypothetical protein
VPARVVGVVFLATVLLATATDDSSAARSKRPSRWRTSRYGRQGAEIWLEAPRLGLATAKGYRNGARLYGYKVDDFDLLPGWGFGFGLMFALYDQFAVEFRYVQTSHDVANRDKRWDLDQMFAGARYVFFHDKQYQVFVGAGGVRQTLELDSTEFLLTNFERLSGYGWYSTAGLDYVASSRWVVSLRADYVLMKYAHVLVGTDEKEIEIPFDGSSFGTSISFNYRIPIWW